MPTYDYRCVSCGTEFEVVHGMSAPSPRCIACGDLAERVILVAPVVHGAMARGRDRAARSLPQCGKGCRCCP